MKIAILSQNAELYSTRRLVEAGEARGHELHVISYLRCYMNITAHNPMVMFEDAPLEGYDAVIPRIGASKTFYGSAVVRQFEIMGVYTPNVSQAIIQSRDKLRCLQLLAEQGIALPATGFANSTKDIEGLINVVGGAPLVVKMLEGTQGIGVILTETNQAAKSVIEAFRGVDANILVQEYIKEAKGADVRALVVGNKVVAAMRRQAAPGEFRSNLHRGGSAEAVKLSAAERNTALRAAKAMGLNVAGVDLLRSKRGPVVMEVNSSPGLEGVEKATDVDVADAIIRFLETQVTKPKPKRKKSRQPVES